MLLLLLIASFCVSLGSCVLEVKYAPPVTYSFPCNDNPRYLTQEYVLPETNETVNKWRGTFYTDQWVNSANVKLDIVFDHPAELVVNPRVVHIINLDEDEKKSFRLTTVQSPKTISRIEFTVKAADEDRGQFPSVLSLNVNGIVLCDNKGRATNVDLIQGLSDGLKSASGQREKNRCGVRYPILAESKEVIDWPWRISMFTKDEETTTNGQWTLSCGGTLIGANRVLTAARCVKDRKKEDILIGVGKENATVQEIFVHQEFQEASLKDDLAVMVISSAELRYPICLNADWAAPNPENETIGALDRAHNGLFQDMVTIDGIRCLEENRKDFGKFLSSKNICVKSESNPQTRILPGDGLYEQFFDEKHQSFLWKIKGVASFTQSSPYFLFTDVTKYFSFIGDSTIKKGQ